VLNTEDDNYQLLFREANVDGEIQHEDDSSGADVQIACQIDLAAGQVQKMRDALAQM
jgi:hypothetical protein